MILGPRRYPGNIVLKMIRLVSALVAALAPLPLAAAVPGGCATASSSICIEQVGNRNSVTVDERGDGNGGGSLAGHSSGPLAVLGGAAVGAPITVLPTGGGEITQRGDSNSASLLVRGDDNQFSLAQEGDRNSSDQLVLGSRNVSSSVQTGSDNVSAQLVIGSDNRNQIIQSGDGNVALARQVPSAELALLNAASNSTPASLINVIASGALGGVDDSIILLEQDNGGNVADLLQIGSGHSIALRQDGNASISITQMGPGKSISVEQTAGSKGIQIVQH
jgi:hypothetical protein